MTSRAMSTAGGEGEMRLPVKCPSGNTRRREMRGGEKGGEGDERRGEEDQLIARKCSKERRGRMRSRGSTEERNGDGAGEKAIHEERRTGRCP